MPRQAKGLSARRVETVKEPGLFADGGGLYLQVTGTGTKTWIFRYVLNGKRRDMGLGGVSTYSLVEAREKALEARKLVKAGIDPIDARKHQAAPVEAAPVVKAMTFKDAAEAFIESKRAGWRSPKHAAQWIATLDTYAYPSIGATPINAIDAAMVLGVLQPIWTTKPETAARVRGRIESVLDFAKVLGKRDGDNPARWKGHLALVLPARSDVAKVEHHASLPYAELPGFFVRLQVHDGISSRALEFTVLTACRTGEVLGARWDEIDMEAALWTIPAIRMKAGNEHRVPLTGPALELLRKMAAIRMSGGFVFPGHAAGKPLSNMSMAMVLRRIGVDVTPHGFRATFRTWVAEQTNYPADVAEAALAHTQGKLMQAYQRGELLDKRRALMAAWAAHCTGAGSTVVQISTKRSA